MQWEKVFEAILTLSNLVFLVYLIIFSFSQPILYDVSVNLIDFRFKVGIHAQVKPKMLKTSSIGVLTVDTSALGISERCISGVGDNVLLWSSYLAGFMFATTEELAPATVGTELETCDWNNVNVFERSDGAICSSINCDNGVLALARAESVQELYNFVVSKVFFGIVFLDVIITIVDVLVLYVTYKSSGWKQDDTTKVALTTKN